MTGRKTYFFKFHLTDKGNIQQVALVGCCMAEVELLMSSPYVYVYDKTCWVLSHSVIVSALDLVTKTKYCTAGRTHVALSRRLKRE